MERLRTTPGLLLVLDECHHLLEVWGSCSPSSSSGYPSSRVLGLTATPPATLDADQARLVDDLFGGIVFQAGVPALVREGDLAPYLELAHLVTPTEHEEEWLAAEATRFAELTTRLMDPTFGSLPFLQWLDERFVTAVPRVEVAPDAARRGAAAAASSDMLALPPGAVLSERHRRPPTPGGLGRAHRRLAGPLRRRQRGPARRRGARAVVRRALPAVGYVWTRRGIRVGRSTVDRVLARSLAKTTATVGLVAQEWDVLGDHARVLVLCDHERATAIVPRGARRRARRPGGLGPLRDRGARRRPRHGGPRPAARDRLGRSAAGERTLRALVEEVRATDPRLADTLVVEPGDGRGDRSPAPGPVGAGCRT